MCPICQADSEKSKISEIFEVVVLIFKKEKNLTDFQKSLTLQKTDRWSPSQSKKHTKKCHIYNKVNLS